MNQFSACLLGATLAPVLAAAPQDYANLERRHLPDDLSTFAAHGAALADFDGDGYRDLLNGNILHLNLGAGRFGPGVAAPSPLGPRQAACAVGDWDGDGALDFVHAEGSRMVALLGDGAGSFAVAGITPALAVSIILVGDYDGDGRLDLLVREFGRVALCLGDGAGGFAPGVTILQHSPIAPSDLDVSDVDRDGDLDLLVVGHIGGGIGYTRLYANDGAGNFADVAGAVPAQAASAAEFADLDGDGDDDLVVMAFLSDFELRVLLNQGGVFVDAGAVGPQTVKGYEIFRIADVTGDGFADLLFFGYRECTVFQGDGALRFSASTSASIPEGTDELRAALVADLDGDLDVDVVASSVLRPHLLLNVDQGRFAAGATDGLPRARVFTRHAYVGDLDFGGPQSLLLLNSTGEGPVLFRPDRRGGYERDDHLPILGQDASWAVFEDLSGNGSADVYVAFGAPGGSGGPGQDLFFRGSRGRLFDDTARSLPAVVDTTLRVFAGDLDGDGRKDLLKRVSGPSGYQILLQQSDFTFAAGGSVAGGTDQLPSALADLDLDGDLDMVTNRGVFLNDGAANFAAAGAGWPTFPDVTYEAVAADFDGDGDDDLFVVRSGFSSNGGQDLLFENRAGQLVDVTFGHIPFAADQSISAHAADFDGDGDLDLFVNRNTADKYLRNDGGLRFSAQPLALPSSGAYSAGVQAVGDFDGDSDLDVLQGSRIAANLETQIHAPYLASIGARFEVELYSAGRFGGASALVALGPDRGFRQVVPGIAGFLQLDLANSGELARVTVPASGTGRPTVVGLDIPLQPVLLGIDFAVQAVYGTAGGEFRFSNAVSGEIQ